MLTTSVEPVEAKPGETVTFKVTAKLDPGFHIYKYSKTNGPGPVSTSFDFFDTAGLKVEGDWVASREPEKHKDPNFAEVDVVEYHEDEVTWSIKVKIPDGTAPGKKTLRCQARYQVCDAKLCSIPGQWTLPEAVLTVLPGNGSGPKAAAAAKLSDSKACAASPAGTKSQTTRPRSRPRPTSPARRPRRPRRRRPSSRPRRKPPFLLPIPN